MSVTKGLYARVCPFLSSLMILIAADCEREVSLLSGVQSGPAADPTRLQPALLEVMDQRLPNGANMRHYEATDSEVQYRPRIDGMDLQCDDYWLFMGRIVEMYGRCGFDRERAWRWLNNESNLPVFPDRRFAHSRRHERRRCMGIAS